MTTEPPAIRWGVSSIRLSLIVILLAANAICADDPEKPKDIDTDRPDVAPYTVPKGSVQFENGVAWTGDEQSRAIDLTESLVRVGLTASTEIRVGVPTYFENLGRLTQGSGFSDLLIGAKQSIGHFAGFDLAAVPALSLPTGSRVRSSHRIDPQFELPWQHELTHGWDISGTLGVFYGADDQQRITQGENQVEIEKEIGPRADVFFEYQSLFGNGLANNSLQLGGGYKLRPNQRLDYFIVIGLSRAAPNLSAGLGYSFRIDKVASRR